MHVVIFTEYLDIFTTDAHEKVLNFFNVEKNR
jgi:hypothetical protein